MVIGSGNGSYEVLRWDGTCSRGVEAEMIGRVRPARPKSAHVQWHRIGAALQDALIAGSEPVKRAHARRGKECQGASSGDVSKSCEAADQALVDAIVMRCEIAAGSPSRPRFPRRYVAREPRRVGMTVMSYLGAHRGHSGTPDGRLGPLDSPSKGRLKALMGRRLLDPRGGLQRALAVPP